MAASAPGPIAPPPSSFSQVDVVEALKALQAQNRQLRRLQEVSYQWQLQHHANLKKIMAALNRLSEVLQERTGAKAMDLQADENKALFQPFAQEGYVPPPESATSLHDLIMLYRAKPTAPELQAALMQLTAEQFDTLHEVSAEIASGVMSEWIAGADRSLQCLAAVFLLETAKKFPAIFSSAGNARLTRRCLEGLIRVIKTNPDALSPEEFAELQRFLMSATAADPTKH